MLLVKSYPLFKDISTESSICFNAKATEREEEAEAEAERGGTTHSIKWCPSEFNAYVAGTTVPSMPPNRHFEKVILLGPPPFPVILTVVPAVPSEGVILINSGAL